MNSKVLFPIICCCFINHLSFAQDTIKPNDNINDSLRLIQMGQVEILSSRPAPERLAETNDNYIFSGKKNEVIRLAGIHANLINNNARQVFARVPGISVWESDGSGIQISIAARGLSPNRSWEFNTRQNGYDISSDVFGYPEAYYNPPLEAVEKIQIIRGAASLQFGPQFGGVINYILKRETANKPFTFETQNAVGSYGMFSSFNAIGGNIKKFSYYAYNHSRTGDGWRENGKYKVRNSHAFVQYSFNKKARISAEYTNMDFTQQQSGGLTDAQFADNNRQSLRSRNWMGVKWNLANINFDYKPSENLSFNLKVFGLLGDRGSVGFTARPNVKDTINAATLQYNSRQVDADYYRNLGTELRGFYSYNLFGQKHSLAFGLRAYQANTLRHQKGTGTTGSNFDLTITNTKFPVDYNFGTQSAAIFAEHLFKIGKNLSVTPGIRYEYIKSSIEGRANIVNGSDVNLTPQTINRNVIISGLGLQYKIKATNIYANFSQAYRPVLFSDLTPPATTDVIDPNLKDANGFNADLGYRGILSDYLNFDVSVFYLQYNNRIGTIRKFLNDDPTQNTYQYRTNLGKSVNKGVEAYLEFHPFNAFLSGNSAGDLSVFASMSFISAEYVNFKTTAISGTAPNITLTEGNLSGNNVEYAPSQIHSFGLSYYLKGFTVSVQSRYSGAVYSDASNTETPTADGIAGKVESYNVFDLSLEYKFLQKYNLKGGINNLTDLHYATRRAGGYPGPGLLPSEGRTFYLSVGAKF